MKTTLEWGFRLSASVCKTQTSGKRYSFGPGVYVAAALVPVGSQVDNEDGVDRALGSSGIAA